jgi:phage shock protein A
MGEMGFSAGVSIIIEEKQELEKKLEATKAERDYYKAHAEELEQSVQLAEDEIRKLNRLLRNYGYGQS